MRYSLLSVLIVLTVLGGCATARRMNMAVENSICAIERNCYVVDRSTQTIARNSRVVAESSHVIAQNHDAVQESSLGVQQNLHTIQKSTEAIQANVQAVSDSTRILADLKPGGSLFFIGAFVLFVALLIPTVANFFFLSRMERRVQRLTKQTHHP